MPLDPRIVRRAEVATRQAAPAWYWCSFATDEANLGCVIVRAKNAKSVRYAVRNLGCDPGGEMMATLLHGMDKPPKAYRNRLISTDEICSEPARSLFGIMKSSELDQEELEIAEDVSFVDCGEH